MTDPRANGIMRPDLGIVASMIPRGSRVLDLGCGDGALLAHLISERDCRGQGVEVSPEAFHRCLARGIAVVSADIDEGLSDFADDSFDAVVLSQTLPSLHRPLQALREMMRVAPLAVVSFPNFGHWRLRADLLFHGRMPTSRTLPYPWHDSPNIRFCTISDFERLLADGRWTVLERRLLDARGQPAAPGGRRRPNLLAAGAVYAITR